MMIHDTELDRDRTPTTKLSDITWDSQVWRLNIPPQPLRLLRAHLQHASRQSVFLIANIQRDAKGSVLLAVDRVDESDAASGPAIVQIDETPILVMQAMVYIRDSFRLH